MPRAAIPTDVSSIRSKVSLDRREAGWAEQGEAGPVPFSRRARCMHSSITGLRHPSEAGAGGVGKVGW